jgi:hypothetical protein
MLLIIEIETMEMERLTLGDEGDSPPLLGEPFSGLAVDSVLMLRKDDRQTRRERVKDQFTRPLADLHVIHCPTPFHLRLQPISSLCF